MSAALIALAQQVGAPLLLQALRRKIGGKNTYLVEGVLDAVATRAGIDRGGLDDFAEQDPETVRHAIQDVESAVMPELLASYETALVKSHELQLAEMSKGPMIAWLWRPLWMYGLFTLWAWHTVGLHIANAVYKTAIPPMDLTILMGLTSVFLTLYMGGHTVKDAIKSWKRST